MPPTTSVQLFTVNAALEADLYGTLARVAAAGFTAVEIMFAIIWAASDDFDAAGFVTATTALTAAYLLSRGIAKASRVLEH